MKKILVVDIGGTHVKLMFGRAAKRQFDSGKNLGPRQLAARIKETTRDWKFDAISIGFPSPVKNGRVAKEAKHLAKGWIGFDFRKSLGKPTRVINDASMQAIGSYRGGRMLFLGLGTGLGSTLIWDNNVLPLELADLPTADGATLEDRLGMRGLQKLGEAQWRREVRTAMTQLKTAFIADYVVLGGGHVARFKTLPKGIERGSNSNAYLGGTRLWQTRGRSGQPKWNVLS